MGATCGKKPARAGVLVVVESDAKAATLAFLLGPGYDVFSTNGHLIDLPRSRLGVDVVRGFVPEYRVVRGKAPLLKALLAAAGCATSVLLATDDDREGEAIALHIRDAILKAHPDMPVARLCLAELSAEGLALALAAPRPLDEARARSQEARRILDRLIGFRLSALLWKKVKNGLSAGRVQSYALHLLCAPWDPCGEGSEASSWTIVARFGRGRAGFAAELASVGGNLPAHRAEADAEALAQSLRSAAAASPARVVELFEEERCVPPPEPFTTASLCACAAERLGFSCGKTLRLVRELYEGIDIGEGPQGFVSFPLTETSAVGPRAHRAARDYVAEHYPAELPPEPHGEAGLFCPFAGAQNARQAGDEAIRPLSVEKTPSALEGRLSKDQHKLYALIWERFVASRMSPAKFRITQARIRVGDALFCAKAARLVEEGYRKALALLARGEERETAPLPALSVGEELPLCAFVPRASSGPHEPRYTEARLVAELEAGGVGRHAAYAPLVATLVERAYVRREGRALLPTELGRAVDAVVSEAYPPLVEDAFSRALEASLDALAAGRADWTETVKSVYAPFAHALDEAEGRIAPRRDFLDTALGENCAYCGRPLVKRLGRRGFFIACSGFPSCRYTRSLPLARCPRCGEGDIVARRRSGTRGREFYGCTRYPDCAFVSHARPVGGVCPVCGWFLVERGDRRGGRRRACGNPDCPQSHGATVPAAHTDVGHG